MTPALAIWLISSIAGLALATWGIRDAILDLNALREIPRNGRWMVARHQLLRYLLRASMGVCFVLAAVVGDVDWTIGLLVLSNVLLAVITLSDLATAAFLRRGVRATLEERGNDGSGN